MQHETPSSGHGMKSWGHSSCGYLHKHRSGVRKVGGYSLGKKGVSSAVGGEYERAMGKARWPKV